jgi:hypothetical protein
MKLNFPWRSKQPVVRAPGFRRGLSLFCASGLFVIICFSSHAVLLVTPNDLAESEGNVPWGYPFGFNLQVTRVQQVYDRSQFYFMTNGGFIDGISFRMSGHYPWPPPSVSFPLTIILSTTTNGVGQLSSTFAQNSGSNAVTVYSGTFPFKTLALNGVVEPFGMVIPFSSSFFYDPAGGNLLVDIVVGLADESGGPVIIDADQRPGDLMSSVTASNPPYNLTLPTNGSIQQLCMVTQFAIGSGAIRQPTLSIAPISASNILIIGTNGFYGGLYKLLSATNAAAAATNWNSVSTGAFDSNGSFLSTNIIATNQASGFYKLIIQ